MTEIKNKTTLEEVFRLFCGNDALRPVLLNPFVVGDKTYATDAYTMVCCDNDKIDFEFTNRETPLNVSNVIPENNTSEIIDIDSVDWNLLLLENETIGDGSDVECGNCKGEGTCDDSVYYKNKLYNFEYDCPVCEGSGYEEEENQIPTGNKTFKLNDKVKLKDVTFFASKFYKLKKVKDLMNCDVELIQYNTTHKGITFKIGFLDVLIMPTMNADDRDDTGIIARF
jgi:hypothetical protein